MRKKEDKFFYVIWFYNNYALVWVDCDINE